MEDNKSGLFKIKKEIKNLQLLREHICSKQEEFYHLAEHVCQMLEQIKLEEINESKKSTTYQATSSNRDTAMKVRFHTSRKEGRAFGQDKLSTPNVTLSKKLQSILREANIPMRISEIFAHLRSDELVSISPSNALDEQVYFKRKVKQILILSGIVCFNVTNISGSFYALPNWIDNDGNLKSVYIEKIRKDYFKTSL